MQETSSCQFDDLEIYYAYSTLPKKFYFLQNLALDTNDPDLPKINSLFSPHIPPTLWSCFECARAARKAKAKPCRTQCCGVTPALQASLQKHCRAGLAQGKAVSRAVSFVMGKISNNRQLSL